MSLYDNAECPVCHNAFEEGDDVVYCPECGTPHHRECYSLAGHCANEGLHKSGYNYHEEHKKDNQQSNNSDINNRNTEKEPNIIPPVIQEMLKNQQEAGKEKIGENTVGEISAAVRTNAARFVAVFKRFEETKKKTSWNWGAFIFGSLYFFYRKMYKQGVLFLSAFIAILFGSNYAMLSLAPKASEAMMEVSKLYASSNGAASSELTEAVNALNSVSDIKTAVTISYIAMGAVLLMRLIAGIFADSFYEKRVNEIISKTNEIMKNGESVGKIPPIPDAAVNLNEAQLKQIYLSRLGGTSFFAPLIAFFAMELIIRLVSSL